MLIAQASPGPVEQQQLSNAMRNADPRIAARHTADAQQNQVPPPPALASKQSYLQTGMQALRRTADGDMVFPLRAHILTKHAIGEVLIHAPKRCHKNRDHPDHLRDRALAKH